MLPYVPRRDFTDVLQVTDPETEIILDYLGGSLEGRRVRDLAKENVGKMRHRKDLVLLLTLRQREVISRTRDM